MSTYSKELKEKVIAKLFPPHNVSVPDLSLETGIPKDTLYGWRSNALKQQPVNIEDTWPSSLNGDEKFHVVLETSTLNETELSEYCRSKGLYPEQIKAWRSACINANELLPKKAERENNRRQLVKINELETELNRKEKALAEAAALLILKKKLDIQWEESEDARSTLKTD